MGTLSKTDIQSVSDIKTEIVPVPEWGGDVAVRQLTGTERDAFEASLVKAEPDGKRVLDLVNVTARLCAYCIVDGVTGDRLFADNEIDSLANKSSTALKRVAAVAERLNGMGSKAVDEAEKNSSPAQSGPSTFA